MRTKMVLLVLIGLCVVILIASVPTTHAQSGGTYELTWSTIDGGGATFSTGGTYELGGTIGQPDAGTQSGGTYVLSGGFWTNVVAQLKLYLPLILR
ncbi:MAG: hypothetical protein N2559_17235 [Anaerolineae bacterium]|nr:hypothetical protein [Anaerolineae bacterium]